MPKAKSKEGNNALEIGSIASTNTTFLCGRIDADENKIGLLDCLVYARGEKEVATTGFLDDVDQPGFIYGQVVVGAIPRVDSSLVEVDDGDLNVWALQRNDGTSRATYGGRKRKM